MCLDSSCTLDIQIPPEVRFLSFFFLIGGPNAVPGGVLMSRDIWIIAP